MKLITGTVIVCHDGEYYPYYTIEYVNKGSMTLEDGERYKTEGEALKALREDVELK